MNLHRLDLNLLKLFDVVYTERNLTKASQILHISQPATSNALQRLRESLGDPLFIRERRGVTPTPFADSFAPRVRNALFLLEDGLNNLNQFDPATSDRTFKLSMNDPIEALFLPALMTKIARSAPHINIHCSFVNRFDLAKEMSLGSVDLAIDVAISSDDRVRHEELIEESYVCLVRKQHPLLDEPLTLEKYLEAAHVHVSARRHGLGYVDKQLYETGHQRRIALRTRNPDLAANTVRHSDMLMTVPDHFADYYDLEAIPLPVSIPKLYWRLYWPSRAEHDIGNQWLRQCLCDIAAQYQ